MQITVYPAYTDRYRSDYSITCKRFLLGSQDVDWPSTDCERQVHTMVAEYVRKRCLSDIPLKFAATVMFPRFT